MKMKKHQSHGSHASTGAHKGGGFMEGAGELMSPGSRPGPAAQRQIGKFVTTERPSTDYTSSATPKGMDTYREGEGRKIR